MHNKEIAFLVYSPEKQRKKDNSFDGNYNIGAKVIINELNKAGIKVDYCLPENAVDYQKILVSFTSTYDLIAFYKAVALLSSWQREKRTFKVIGGGFGLQNPTAIRNYLDIAVFGRAENLIVDIVNGKLQEHKSIMRLPDITPVMINQTDSLYRDIISHRKDAQWKEEIIGCPGRCNFCHYSWARKYINDKDKYQGQLNASPEMMWRDIYTINTKIGHLRSAIDGFSERLRFLFGKKITNQQIIEGVEHIGQFKGNTFFSVYNISNMPFETEKDRQEFSDIIKQAKPKNRIVFILHSTPFRPSLCTPMQWFGVNLFPNWNKIGNDDSTHIIFKSDKLEVYNSMHNESPWSHLQISITEKATLETDRLFHALCFSSRLKSGQAEQRIKLLQKNFDLSPYLREYDPDEKHPAWFLSSYTDNEKLKKIFIKLKQEETFTGQKVVKL